MWHGSMEELCASHCPGLCSAETQERDQLQHITINYRAHPGSMQIPPPVCLLFTAPVHLSREARVIQCHSKKHHVPWPCKMYWGPQPVQDKAVVLMNVMGRQQSPLPAAAGPLPPASLSSQLSTHMPC